MNTNEFTGMTERQICAKFRAEKLRTWLGKQEFDSSYNKKQEAVSAFLKCLDEWSIGSIHAVAPTFHFHPHAC